MFCRIGDGRIFGGSAGAVGYYSAHRLDLHLGCNSPLRRPPPRLVVGVYGLFQKRLVVLAYLAFLKGSMHVLMLGRDSVEPLVYWAFSLLDGNPDAQEYATRHIWCFTRVTQCIVSTRAMNGRHIAGPCNGCCKMMPIDLCLALRVPCTAP